MADPVITDQPSAWERIRLWLRSKKTPEQEEADRNDALTAMHMALPDELSAREAILRDRRRKQEMVDEAFK